MYTFLAFLFGAGTFITVRIIGILSLSEILSIFLFPFIVSDVYRSYKKVYSKISFLLFIWLISALITDLYRQTDTLVLLKGAFTIIIFYINFTFAFWILNKNMSHLSFYLWGLAISFWVGTIFGLNIYYQEYIENEGIVSITEANHYHKLQVAVVMYFIWAITATFYKKSPYFVTIIVLVFALYSLLNGSRSTFLFHLIAVFYCLYINSLVLDLRIPKEFIYNFIKKRKLKLLFLIFSAILLAQFIYKFAAEEGYMGEEEYLKYTAQSSSKLGLLSGRSEIAASLIAVYNSPIIGYGSYAKDLYGFNIRAAKLTGDVDDLFIMKFGKDSFIRSHSHIWGTWVNHGIFGVFIWLFLIFLLIKFLIKYSFYIQKYFLISSISIFSILWKVLFSPFSERVYLAFMFSFFIIVIVKLSPKKWEKRNLSYPL